MVKQGLSEERGGPLDALKQTHQCKGTRDKKKRMPRENYTIYAFHRKEIKHCPCLHLRRLFPATNKQHREYSKNKRSSSSVIVGEILAESLETNRPKKYRCQVSTFTFAC
ncbi:unnamed protein product, partial [Ectocarpus sp. 12 AP-2014]